MVERGYKVSHTKAQMFKAKVTCLGAHITRGSRRLSSEWVQGILQLSSPMTQKELQAFLGLSGYCRISIPSCGLIVQPLYESLNGAGWFNPIDVGNSSKEGRDYTKTSLNSSTCLEIAKPRKSIPTLFPRKGRNNLGNVNSKVGTLALACSLLNQEAWPSFPRLAPCLWNIAVLIEVYLKLPLGGYFYQAPSKTTPKWDLWMSNQMIFQYQVVLIEIQAWLYPLVQFLTQLPSCLLLRALSPFTLA